MDRGEATMTLFELPEAAEHRPRSPAGTLSASRWRSRVTSASSTVSPVWGTSTSWPASGTRPLASRSSPNGSTSTRARSAATPCGCPSPPPRSMLTSLRARSATGWPTITTPERVQAPHLPALLRRPAAPRQHRPPAVGTAVPGQARALVGRSLGTVRAGGRFVLNMKDVPRKGKLLPVTAWHIECLRAF